MIFYLGVQEVSHLARISVPAMVSRNRLLRLRDKLPRASAPWTMDSGGFTEVTDHGGWRVSPKDFVREVQFYAREIGNLDWASPCDWMVENKALCATGKTVLEHQQLTLWNYIALLTITGPYPHGPFIPALQGQTIDDYERHADAYEAAGIDLSKERVVGIGSVCRRQGGGDATRILAALKKRGLKMHAYGLSTVGLKTACGLVESADSMAWSRVARLEHIRLPGHKHSDCRNCLEWALAWRERMFAKLPADCVETHPRLAGKHRAQAYGLGLRAVSGVASRGAGVTRLDLSKLVEEARHVLAVNAALDRAEHEEDERSAFLGDEPEPATYRLALDPATQLAVRSLPPAAVATLTPAARQDVERAMSVDPGGPWPPPGAPRKPAATPRSRIARQRSLAAPAKRAPRRPQRLWRPTVGQAVAGGAVALVTVGLLARRARAR